MPPSADAERIYSVSQLSEALQSGLMGLKDQLQVKPSTVTPGSLPSQPATVHEHDTDTGDCLQVLSILDGSSTCWPGVSAAQSDLEQLIKLASAHLSELEASSQQLSAANTRLQGQNSQLAAKLKGAHAKSSSKHSHAASSEQEWAATLLQHASVSSHTHAVPDLFT